MHGMRGHGGFPVSPEELQLIDGGLARLRQDEEAWRALVEAKGLTDVYDSLKERVRRAIQDPAAAVPRRGGCC